MFRVAFDPPANRLTIHVERFWHPRNVAALAVSVGAAVQTARAHGDCFDVLVESLDFPVQSQEVANMLPNIMHAGMTQTRGRAAVVVGSTLNRLQAERTLVHPRVRVFTDMAAAQAWLAEAR